MIKTNFKQNYKYLENSGKLKLVTTYIFNGQTLQRLQFAINSHFAFDLKIVCT